MYGYSPDRIPSFDLAAARTHMLEDPAVAVGIFTGEVSDWRPMFDPEKLFARQ